MDEQLEQDMMENFKIFDKNGDGFITETELLGVMKAMGQNPTEKEVKDVTV